jgi:hypothetical protein
MWIVKGTLLAFGFFLVGLVIFVARTLLKMPMGTSWDIRAFFGFYQWIVLSS